MFAICASFNLTLAAFAEYALSEILLNPGIGMDEKPLLSILKKLAIWPTSYLHNRIQKPNAAGCE
jgi:hypothetical protein